MTKKPGRVAWLELGLLTLILLVPPYNLSSAGMIQPAPVDAPAPPSLLAVANYGQQAIYAGDLNQFNTRWWMGGQQLADYNNQNKMLQAGYHFLPSFNTGYMMRTQGYALVSPHADKAADPHSCIDAPCPLNLQKMQTDATIVHATIGDGGYYNIGNEVDNSYSDDVAPAVYTGQFDAWVSAIKRVDPQAHIVAPSICSWSCCTTSSTNPWGTAGTWFKTFVVDYKRRHEGRKPLIDVLSMHLYNFDYKTAVYSVDAADHYVQEVQNFRRAADQMGYAGVPIWITELGFGYEPKAAALTPAEASQMTRVLTQLVQHAAALHLQRLFYFTGGREGGRQGLMPLYDPNAAPSPGRTLPLTDAGYVLKNVANVPLLSITHPASRFHNYIETV
ncbi:MAG: hypothetical protein JOZ57_06990 [Abitibacteriaceae bacterium]|nr:hypothetical protein [Abditibacteriaceae bacterium]